SNVDMSAKLVARLASAYKNIRYIKESSRDIARVSEVIEATDGVVKVYAGERPVDSFLLGAIGWVNPYGNYIPRPSNRMFELLEQGRTDDARRVQRLVDAMDHIIAEGHPTYGHQCYSKRLAALAGYPVGDVRSPITKFSELGEEGERRVALLAGIMRQLDELVGEIDAKQQPAPAPA
ncbi:MAG TPA: dihydrodipicolinate synthase family protein, partial [Acidimicrobiales bacterium]|nr:dihydrodipicolinate synthase family protein [Acidimicrobiales bacterium]